ncbi:MAG TPA: adenosylcobinamide-GDP ribazoletransferase, partial [Thiotrichales bacterium]|nr:adenosylcobinamide-GDP ribazoletransferase [Thiotrichales bacterium]
PHVGSFGVVVLVLQLLMKWVLLTLLAYADMSAWWLVFVAAWARMGAAWWSLSLPSIKPGLGETFAWQGKVSQLGWGVGALTLASLMLSPALLSALVPVLLWRVWLQWRLGGQTGDALGAGIELSESVTLLLLVIIIQSLV